MTDEATQTEAEKTWIDRAYVGGSIAWAITFAASAIGILPPQHLPELAAAGVLLVGGYGLGRLKRVGSAVEAV